MMSDFIMDLKALCKEHDMVVGGGGDISTGVYTLTFRPKKDCRQCEGVGLVKNHSSRGQGSSTCPRCGGSQVDPV